MSTSTPDEHGPPTEAPSLNGTKSAADAAQTQAALIDLANSVALLPQAPPIEGEEEHPEGAIALPVIEQDGNRYIPVFTTEEALLAAGGDPETALSIPVVELAANWPADDLWLAVDPSTDEGLALPPDLVRALPVVSQSAAGQAGESGPAGGEGGGGGGPGQTPTG
ncbi:SseB family protein [Streptomyces sp. ISL-1]|uniref:SseB family protein n=1 Tax=Streptomyces sp. ISL-1 TaxID=2817657 RepID=UPI001BE6F274|nr:SseB family protein [Streptomyces sp. ISL-1]MBT2390765.1 SseB family protein [Streptomyces sp. ISL-1]